MFSEQKVFAQQGGGCPNWLPVGPEICYWSDSYPTCRSGGGFCGAAQGYPNLTVCEETFKDRHYKNVEQNSCDPSQFRYEPGTEDCHLFVQEHSGWIAEPQCSAGTCGNGVRESYEVCAPSAPATGGNDPANCDGTCHYTGSTASCGDGVCSSNENQAICPEDCSGPPVSCTNPINVGTIGSSNITVTQGNSAGFPYTVNSQADQNVAVAFSGVTGATYSGQQGNFQAEPGNNYWSGVVNTAGVSPGTYALRVSVNSTESAGCSDFYDFNVTVQSSVPPSIPDDAQCAGWSLPSSVNTGQSFSASITMRNTGSNTWPTANYADTYPEGATYGSGPFTFGAQQQRPLSSASIPNNALSSFTYALTAPATAGTYTIKNQMLHHGVAWFGPVCTQNIAVTTPPAATCDTLIVPSSNGQVSNVTSTGYTISWTAPSGPNDGLTRIRIASNLNQTGATQVGTYTGTFAYSSCPNPPLVGAAQCIVNVAPAGTLTTYNVTGAQPNTTYYNRLPTVCFDADSTAHYKDYVFTAQTSAGGATASISANPTTIPYNTASNITWSSSGATSCSVSPTGWSGTSGSQSTGNLTSNRTYTVSCNPVGPNSSSSATVTVQAQATFGLNVIKSGQGTVSSNPAGISCGSTCGYNYPADTSVTLTATPATGRIFVGWGGACSGRGSCIVVINSPKTVLANFAVDPGFKEF